MKVYNFPENFKWGSATSSHQIEGDNNNDWTEWEHANSARRAAEAARRYANAPMRIRKEASDPNNYISGKACDSYNRYEEDFDIAKKLNQSIHRFSIEWSRIEPEEGKFDDKEMQHYVDVVKALRKRGIEPMITLWHFTNPIWFARKGGFINLNSSKYFTRYVKYVVEHLKSDVGLWITLNEATTVYSGFAYLKGFWPPHHKSVLEWRRVNKNIVQAHISAYKEIKRIYNSPVNDINNSSGLSKPDSSIENVTSHNVRVGVTENNAYVVPSRNIIKKTLGDIYNYYRNLYFFTKALPYYDFIGLNYYNIDRKPFKNFDVLPKQDWWLKDKNWEIYPEGLYKVLKQLKKFKKPIYITENGTTGQDDLRKKFIKEHLRWVYEAIQDGVDVRGYLYWSLLDNFEINDGFSSKFGLVEIDYNTFERKIRPSALEYAKICKYNQLEY